MDYEGLGIETGQFLPDSYGFCGFYCGKTFNDGRYHCHFCARTNKFMIFNIFNGTYRYFESEGTFSADIRYYHTLVMLDNHNVLMQVSTTGDIRLMLFTLNFETQSFSLKYEFLDSTFTHDRGIFMLQNGGRLIIMPGLVENAIPIKYSLYNFDSNYLEINKCHESRIPLVDHFCVNWLEDQLFLFSDANYDLYTLPRTVSVLKSIYCFDLKDEKLTKFDIKLPDSISALETNDEEEEYWTFNGVWVKRDFYCVFHHTESTPSFPGSRRFIGAFNWTTKLWNPVLIPSKTGGIMVFHIYVESRGILTMFAKNVSTKYDPGAYRSIRVPVTRPEMLLNLTLDTIKRRFKGHNVLAFLKDISSKF